MPAALLVASLFVALLPLRAARAGDDAALGAAARGARKAVVRVIWRDARFSDRTYERNAVVVRQDGLLLMAGPPPRRGGTLTVRFSDRAELRARLLASDTETTLSLLQVDRTGLPVLSWRQEPAVAVPAVREQPGSKSTVDRPAAKAGSASTGRRLRAHAPLLESMPPIGLRVAMVTGDGAVAFGPIRSLERHGALTDPRTGRRVKTTGLLGVTLASIDADAGSPLLDDRGHVVGLVVGRREMIDPEQAASAARSGLRQRPSSVEVVALPASVVELAWPLLESQKRVPRVALGISTKPVEADLAAHLKIDGGHVIERLDLSGMGQRQGLQLHDVIIAIDGHGIAGTTTLHDALLPFQPGARVTLEVVRGGKRLKLPIRTGER